jgi:hypothetical protein
MLGLRARRCTAFCRLVSAGLAHADRVSDDETEGLQPIGPMEWIRVTVGRPRKG